MTEPGPAVRRRQLGRQLRDLRIAADFKTIEAAAVASGLSRATISRVERAKQVILPKTVRTLCHTYGIGQPMLDHMLRLALESDDRGWLVAYSATVPDWFERYVGEEAEATRIRGYEPEFIPGLLQVDEYTVAVSTAARPHVTAEGLAESVAFRNARQARLGAADPPELWFVINEAAIRRLVGGTGVMHAQLLRLVELAQRSNITLQILPFEAGAHPAMTGSFKLLDFPGDAGLGTIFVEIDSGAVYPDQPADVERYAWIWERLTSAALSPADSVSLLSSVADVMNPGIEGTVRDDPGPSKGVEEVQLQQRPRR